MANVNYNPQEAVDLVEHYKTMIQSEGWQDYEQRLKGLFTAWEEELKRDRLGEQRDSDTDYYELKMLQAKIRAIRDIMEIPLMVFAKGAEAEKELHRRKDAETS